MENCPRADMLDLTQFAKQIAGRSAATICQREGAKRTSICSKCLPASNRSSYILICISTKPIINFRSSKRDPARSLIFFTISYYFIKFHSLTYFYKSIKIYKLINFYDFINFYNFINIYGFTKNYNLTELHNFFKTHNFIKNYSYNKETPLGVS